MPLFRYRNNKYTCWIKKAEVASAVRVDNEVIDNASQSFVSSLRVCVWWATLEIPLNSVGFILEKLFVTATWALFSMCNLAPFYKGNHHIVYPPSYHGPNVSIIIFQLPLKVQRVCKHSLFSPQIKRHMHLTQCIIFHKLSWY